MKEKIKKIFSKRNIEWLVLTGYTFINIKALSLLIFDPDSILISATQVFGNWNLLAIFIGLFLNTGLLIYSKLLTSRRLEGILLIIYTYLNLRVVFPFVVDRGKELGFAIFDMNGGGNVLFGIVIGLFLNAALIIYWLKSNHE